MHLLRAALSMAVPVDGLFGLRRGRRGNYRVVEIKDVLRTPCPRTLHVLFAAMSTKPQTKSFKGCTLFRHRIVAATLSGKAIRISDIRSNTVSPALSFRKLLAPRVLCDTANMQSPFIPQANPVLIARGARSGVLPTHMMFISAFTPLFYPALLHTRRVSAFARFDKCCRSS